MDNTNPLSRQQKRDIVAIVDAPVIGLSDDEQAGDVLLKFYYALGWNGTDNLDPTKINTTSVVWHRLYDIMLEKCPDTVAVGMAMVNKAPSVDDGVPPNKVYLLDRWVKPPEAK